MAKSGLKTVTRLRRYLNGVPTLETKANVEGDEHYIAPYKSLESCPVKAEDTTTTSTTTTSTTTTTTNAQGKVPICLLPSAPVSVSGGVLLFGKNSTTNSQYKVGIGTYKLTGIPMSHPIAFLNNGVSTVSYTGTYTGGTKTASDGNSYTYYWGTITLTITGSFSDMDYECYNHGYMGGQDNLTYDASCVAAITTTSTTTTTNKIGTMKTWKADVYTHTANVVDIDLNTIQYMCNLPNTGIYANNFTTAGFVGTGTIPKAGDFVTGGQYGYIGRQFTTTNKEFVFKKIHDHDKILVIRNSDGKVIKVKQCASDEFTQATDTLFLSKGYNRLQEFCGLEYLSTVSYRVTPTNTISELDQKTVFRTTGEKFDGRNLYYIPSIGLAGSFDGRSRFEWIRIGSNGVVNASGSFRDCIGGGEVSENIY